MGKKGKKEKAMGGDVDKLKLPELEAKNNSHVKRRVLFFCYKHPKMKFTAERIPLNSKENRTTLKDELQALVTKEIVSQQISDTGAPIYCLNRTKQELARLAPSFASVQQ